MHASRCFPEKRARDGGGRQEVHAGCGGPTTTGNREFAVCRNVGRVLFFGHTVNRTFAVSRELNTRRTKHTANRDFAVCTRPDTQRIKTLPCAHQTAHGEMGSTLTVVRCSSTPSAFTVCPQPSTRRTFIFAVCLGAAHGEVMAPLTDIKRPWTSSPLP